MIPKISTHTVDRVAYTVLCVKGKTLFVLFVVECNKFAHRQYDNYACICTAVQSSSCLLHELESCFRCHCSAPRGAQSCASTIEFYIVIESWYHYYCINVFSDAICRHSTEK